MAIDDIDRRILRLLQEDARRPLKSIAGEVGLARSSVRERIGRLEASGVIRRYTAELSPGPGGALALRAFLFVRLEKTPARDVVGKIVSYPEVARCYSVGGDIDLIVELRAADMGALNDARDRIALEARVADVTTAVVLRCEKGEGDLSRRGRARRGDAEGLRGASRRQCSFFRLRRRRFELPHAAARARRAPRGLAMATFDASAARGVLSNEGFRRWALVASLARMPAVMAPFGLLLAGHEATGSYADGAFMVSVYAFGAAAAAPFRGRALDRAGLPGALRGVLIYEAILLVALGAAAAAHAPLALLLGLSLGFGVVPSGALGGVRALLTSLPLGVALESAFALDAAMFELLWVLGPLFVGASAALNAPLSAIAVMALCALAASALTGRLPERAQPSSPPAQRGGLWRLPGVSSILVVSLSFGVSWGALEAGLPPRLEQLGAKAAFWGVLSALLAASSACGGVAYAVAPKAENEAGARRRVVAFATAWACLLLPVAWALRPSTLAIWFTSAGFVLAPLSAQLNSSLQRALPSSRHAEGFAVYGACWSAGMATGTAIAGAILERWGPVPLLMLAPLLPFVASLVGAWPGRAPSARAA